MHQMINFVIGLIEMKIFSASQIRSCDEFTIKNEPISSLHLMERAAQCCADYLIKTIGVDQKVYLFCGHGNNGGDGFAIARMLYYLSYDVSVFIDCSQMNFSEDAAFNLNQLRSISGIGIYDFKDVSGFVFAENSVFIDALFGSGLNRKIEGNAAILIDQLNQIEACKISIDVPSGIFVDQNIELHSVVFEAQETLSFQFYKRAFLHPETGKYCGKITIFDIGLHPTFIENTSTDYFTIDEPFLNNIYRARNEFSHKGNFGKSCIIAGSFGKIGAAVLATKSALKSGSGLTFVMAPRCGYEILQTACPEAMYLYGGQDFIQHFEVMEGLVCGIGPGLGTDPETSEQFLEFLENYSNPLVLDADALNIISKEEAYVRLIPEKSIITPHPKEFARLFGETANSYERLELAKKKAVELRVYIVLKDHHTQVVTPEGIVYYNITGNAGLAKGGSGDVLLGIITSLLAQGYSPRDASVFGVWLHGRAADLAAEQFSKESMLPSDVIDCIGEVFKKLY